MFFYSIITCLARIVLFEIVLCQAQYKSVDIYKVPGGNNEFDSKLREKLIAIVVRHSEIDPALKERIQKKKIFMCQRHFRDDQIVYHESRISLVPDALP